MLLRSACFPVKAACAVFAVWKRNYVNILMPTVRKEIVFLTPAATLAKLLLALYSAWLPAPSWLCTAFLASTAELWARLVKVAPFWSGYELPRLLKPWLEKEWEAEALWSAGFKETNSFDGKYPADALRTENKYTAGNNKLFETYFYKRRRRVCGVNMDNSRKGH